MCHRRQRDMPRESSSQWVPLIKDLQPAGSSGRKKVIKRPTSGLSTGHQLTFIMS